MRYRFIVEVEAEHETGKFESRDDIGAELSDVLETANPEEITGSNDGLYTLVEWSVMEDAS